jgi:predicted N-formylglutamate amidohydrolase
MCDCNANWRRAMTEDAVLGAGDPPPVLRQAGRAGWLLTVEHAGRAVPARLGDLGLPPGEIDRHIGWDPGALDLAQALAQRLEATLVAQPYSRLVIDCNRPWGAPDLVPPVSDGTPVPANAGLPEADLRRRWEAIHAPFHAAVAAAAGQAVCGLIAVHSYDPQRRTDAAPRPWPVGLLWRQANPLAEGLAHALGGDPAAMPLGINRPYAIDDASDYTIPIQAEPRRLPHVLLEVRNDLLRTPGAVAAMADLLARACLEAETT